MQLYVLDRSKNTLESTSDFYNEKHLTTLGAGGATFDFTIDKTDDAAAYMDTGNYVVFQDDRGRGWSFNIINYDENQLTKTVYCEDTSLGLLNKAMDVWANMGNHTFEYYFDLVTKDTPWTLGINQVSGLSRTLTYTGRDTGLGRLLSVLTAFDHAECKFNVKIKQNQPVEFVVDVYKQIGTVQENIQIVHDVELNDITKTESRAAFVTAIKGVGGTIEQESDGTTVTTAAEEQHVDFTDLEYDDGDYFTVKGDPFLRARTANKKFNPNQEDSYIEDFYDYDTQDVQELLNRTLTQLKTYSEPQYSYDADVQVIDPTLEIGDTVTIIDHDYNPALYLSARVATLEKCYSDPTQNKITFTNYQILNSKIDDKIRAMQNIINAMPSASSISAITTNLKKINDTIDQLTIKLTGSNGKNSNYYGADEPTDAQQGDTWFQDAGDGKTIIKQFVDGGWKIILDTSLTDDINTQLEDAKKDIAAAQKTADDAVAQATLLATQFQEQTETVNALNDAVDAAKNDASASLASATKAIKDAATAMTDAQTALDNANGNSQKLVTIQSDLDTVNGTLKTLATQQFVDELNKTVTTVQTLSEQTAEGLKQKVNQTIVDTLNKTVTTQSASLETALNQLKLKADTTIVNGLNDSVTKLTGDLTTAADQLKLMATKTELTNATSGLATQNYVDSQLTVEAGKINSTIQSVQNQVNNSAVGANLLQDTKEFSNRSVWADFNGTASGNEFHFASAVSTSNLDFLQQVVSLESGTTYTYSFYAKGTTKVSCFVYNTGTAAVYADNYHNFNLTSDYQRFTMTFVTGQPLAKVTQRVLFRKNSTDNEAIDITIKEMKLEKGNVATPWCPSMADLATVTALTSVTQTLTQIQQMATDNQGNLATLTTTFNGLQSIVSNKADSSTVTQLANQWTAKLTDYATTAQLTATASDINLRINSVSTNLLTESTWYADYNGTMGVATHNFYTGKYQLFLHHIGTLATYSYVKSGRVQVKPYTDYTFSFVAFGVSNITKENVYFLGRPSANDKDYNSTTGIHLLGNFDPNPSKAVQYSWTFNTGDNTDGYFRLNQNIPGLDGVGGFFFAEAQLTEGKTMVPFTLGQSSMSQLNLEAGTALFQSDRILMDASSTIFSGNAFIPGATIKDASISNAKIANATIMSAKIANLDGSKIVANSITADKMAANFFQVGLDNYGDNIKITPDSIQVYTPGISEPTTVLTQDGIGFRDNNNAEQLGSIFGGPMYTSDPTYNGIQISMFPNDDLFALNKVASDNTTTPKFVWSQSNKVDAHGINLGFNFYDYVTFTKPLVILDKIYDKWSGVSFHVTNYNGAGVALINDAGAGVCFGNDGHLYFLNKNKYVDSVKALNITGV